MIEFKRAGDAMVFECPAFKIEICADAESIEFADPLHEPIDRVTEAFKILDMIIEHKMRQTHVLKFDFDIDDAQDKLPLGHAFRRFMKKEGL